MWMKLFGLIQRAHNKRSPFYAIISSFWYRYYCRAIVVNVFVCNLKRIHAARMKSQFARSIALDSCTVR